MPADPLTAEPVATPAVAAVVVIRDPGSWLDESLRALGNQDYPNLSLIIVDTTGEPETSLRIQAAAPDAYVLRLKADTGFSAAVNAAVGMVEGASHFVICHDDVAPTPEAVRLLVEEAFRSNAGIASPKYVEWDRSDRLMAVGATTDWAGMVRGLVEPGELDQAQHDRVREILVAPGGMTLVRSDLFKTLGGFGTGFDGEGRDLDLSWRAKLVGARLVVVPAATVRHAQEPHDALSRQDTDIQERLALRRRETEVARYRTVLTCYKWFNLVWTLPLGLLWALVEALVLVARGRRGEAWATLSAPVLSLRRPAELLRSRRAVQRSRRVGDRALRSLQAGTASQVTAFLRSRAEHLRIGVDHRAEGIATPKNESGRPLSAPGGRRALVALLAVGFVVLLFGSRNILGHGLPQIGQLPHVTSGWGSIWADWWSGWQTSGLGVAGPATPMLALIGVAATATFGAVGTLAQLLALLPFVVGPAGAYRGARWWGSKRGQLLAAVTYAIIPLAYNSVSKGDWEGLVAFAAAPWVLSRIVELSAAIPVPRGASAALASKVLVLGALIGATAAGAPSFFYVALIVGIGLIVGSLVAGDTATVLRFAAGTAASVAAGFVLTLPWSATVFSSPAALGGPSLSSADRLGWAAVLRFHTGPYGSGAWEWLILVAAALALVLGRGWRLAWASRLWAVALVSFGVAWAASRGALPNLPADVVLAPAAAALASAVALGAASFEIDLPGYRFGWRQGAAGAGAVCLALASVPFVAASGSGRWDMPSASPSSALSLLPRPSAGGYRVLWVGVPDVLPLASRRLEPGFGYATTFGTVPSLTDEFPTGSPGASPVLAGDLIAAQDQLTTRLGHLLAPAGVRYIVVANHTGPTGSGSRSVAVPEALLAGLETQTDLAPLDVGDSHYQVYENAAWSPVRSLLPPSAVGVAFSQAAGSSTTQTYQAQRPLQQTDLSSARGVLGNGPGAATGTLPAATGTLPAGTAPAGSAAYVGYTFSKGWSLDLQGANVAPRRAFGWAMGFELPAQLSSTPTATLRYATPWGLRVLQAGELVVIALAVAAATISRRRNNQIGAAARAAPAEWFEPAQPPGRRTTSGGSLRRTPARRTPPAVEQDDSWGPDGSWADD